MDSAWNALVSAFPLPLALVALVCAGLAGAALALWTSRRLGLAARAAKARDEAAAAAEPIVATDATQRDPVTGLMSRPRFETLLDDAVLRCDRDGEQLGVLYVGLDDFKFVNDACGHAGGDQVLLRTARCLREALPEMVAATRIAGDEFVVVVQGDRAHVNECAQALRTALRAPQRVAGQDLRTEASIGIALYPLNSARSRLIVHSFSAMRAAKQAGGAAHAEFEPSMGIDMRQRTALLADLRGALARKEFTLVFQPKIDARSLQITAAEALVRWNHPKRGVVMPAVFIPEAERHGLIGAIGRWVIEEACRQAGEWRDKGLRMRVAVNISGAQLRQDDLIDHIERCLAQHEVLPSRFTCEITESVAMEDTRVTRAAFDRLRQAGVHVSIDDFGTGHSSLATLRRLPAAELKIDRAFITDLDSSDEARLIAGTIVQMAHTLELRVVAEGVETERQRDLLVQLGCDELQGYFFARPMSAQALEVWAMEAQGPSTLAFRESLFAETAPMQL